MSSPIHQIKISTKSIEGQKCFQATYGRRPLDVPNENFRKHFLWRGELWRNMKKRKFYLAASGAWESLLVRVGERLGGMTPMAPLYSTTLAKDLKTSLQKNCCMSPLFPLKKLAALIAIFPIARTMHC